MFHIPLTYRVKNFKSFPYLIFCTDFINFPRLSDMGFFFSLLNNNFWGGHKCIPLKVVWTFVFVYVEEKSWHPFLIITYSENFYLPEHHRQKIWKLERADWANIDFIHQILDKSSYRVIYVRQEESIWRDN